MGKEGNINHILPPLRLLLHREFILGGGGWPVLAGLFSIEREMQNKLYDKKRSHD